MAEERIDGKQILHVDVDQIESKLDTLHTDLGTTVHGDLGTLDTSLAVTQPRQIYGYNGTNARPLNMDTTTRELVTLLREHHMVHEGNLYRISDVQNVNTTTLKWMLTTPNTTKWMHMTFPFECTGEMTMLITEGADRTGTNLLTAVNRNRNSGNTATLVVHRAYSDGSTDGATTILTSRVGATGIAPSKTLAVSGTRAESEWILKQNTKYIVSVTTYADVYVTARFDWYEHTNLVA
jgi:hypothetical protein